MTANGFPVDCPNTGRIAAFESPFDFSPGPPPRNPTPGVRLVS
jgi:hypothetical protein